MSLFFTYSTSPVSKPPLFKFYHSMALISFLTL